MITPNCVPRLAIIDNRKYMDINNTYLFNSIKNMVHRHIPLIYEQINRNFSVFEKDIWKDLEQIEVILQNQTYWGINANLSNMIFDAETLKPVGTVSGRVKLEHYSHWDYIELSCYICNLLSSAYNDFNDDVTTKHRINIQDLNNKKKMVPYLERVENFLYSFPELFLRNVRWVELNLEHMMQSEKFCYIQKVNNEA